TQSLSIRIVPALRTSVLIFSNDTATTEIYTLSLHDALPICAAEHQREGVYPEADGEQADERVGREEDPAIALKEHRMELREQPVERGRNGDQSQHDQRDGQGAPGEQRRPQHPPPRRAERQ